MQDVLKFILVAVSAAVIGYVGWTVYGEGTKPVAARMSESIHLAQTQAQNMNQSLTEVGAIGDVGQSVVSQGNSPSAVEPSVPQRVAEIANLDDLLIEWRHRYEMAKMAYVKFDASIVNAKYRAAEYFAQQQALTDQMRDPDNKARARMEDEAEMALYLQWEVRADSALKLADKIGIQLDDMDANLKKMELRSDFVFDTTAFTEVPGAIAELDQHLFDFQLASENIKLATGSPFEAQRP